MDFDGWDWPAARAKRKDRTGLSAGARHPPAPSPAQEFPHGHSPRCGEDPLRPPRAQQGTGAGAAVTRLKH